MRKRLTLTALLLCLMVNFAFADAHRGVDNKKMNVTKEDGTNAIANNRTVPFIPPFVIDTTGAVPTMTNFYDYQTNGNALRNLWVMGDTIIIAADMTDSLNCQTSTARNSYYQCSFDGGFTWQPAALQVSASGNAYPDASPCVLTGSRTVALTGRQFVAGARNGYVAVDVVLGAGSITSTLVNGQEIFGQMQDATHMACGFESRTTDTLYYAKFDITNNTYTNKTYLAGTADGIVANTRSYTGASTSGKIAIGWWDPAAGDYWYRQSTDAGATWGAKVHAISSTLIIDGTNVVSWLSGDMLYNPSGNLCVAQTTLESGFFGTVRGTKIVFYSPTINGGNPVVIVDYRNAPSNSVMSDTNYYNAHYTTNNEQVGMTALSHPSIAYSNDGSRLYCVYSVTQRDTTSYSFNYHDICESYSTDNGATWSNPVKLTNTPTADEIYPTVARTGCTANMIEVTYALSECPGSTSFTNTTTPRCKVYHTYRRFDPVTGNLIPIGIQNISSEVPKNFSLMQNFPNPFNPSTKIRFALPKAENVTLTVYNAVGQVVKVLADNEMVQAGTNEVTFDAANFASGIYFYSLKTKDFNETKKMVLVK